MRVRRGFYATAAILSGIVLIFAGNTAATARAATTAAKSDSYVIAPLVSGDEPIVVTEHHIHTAHGPLARGSPAILDSYLRDELGYATDLTYTGLEDGYMPTPGPARHSSGTQFYYNQAGLTPEDWGRTLKEGEVTYVARDNPPWIVNAMRRNKGMQVFVATGRFDPLNMCEGDAAATATLTSDLSSRIANHCYESGHVVYRDEAPRLQLSRDLSEFVQRALASQRAAASR